MVFPNKKHTCPSGNIYLSCCRGFLRALAGEVSIMARCTGKTDIHNLESEDLRSITIATARATGIPLAGTDWIPEEESV